LARNGKSLVRHLLSLAREAICFGRKACFLGRHLFWPCAQVIQACAQGLFLCAQQFLACTQSFERCTQAQKTCKPRYLICGPRFEPCAPVGLRGLPHKETSVRRFKRQWPSLIGRRPVVWVQRWASKPRKLVRGFASSACALADERGQTQTRGQRAREFGEESGYWQAAHRLLRNSGGSTCLKQNACIGSNTFLTLAAALAKPT
jgi:hypothetical protein